ncbi:MAG: hypothetical protein IT383_23915 [Deltaproteobacteria bacterium]|nr:hypothetical protein [Deltaproteobacteria bacterium]
MTPQTSPTGAAQQMLALCMQTGPDGTRLYSDADIAAFVPFLLIAFAPAIDGSTLSPAARALVGGLAERLGLDGKDPSAAAAALRAHFAASPPNPNLVQDFERHFRELLKELGPGAAAAAFASFVGAASPKPLSTVGEARPAGTVPASPFARFQVRTPPTKKES